MEVENRFRILEDLKIFKVKGKKVFNRLLKLKMLNTQKLLLEVLVAFSEPGQTSKMELFVKIVNDVKLLTIFKKSSILDVWMGSKYTSAFWKYWKVKDFVISLNIHL